MILRGILDRSLGSIICIRGFAQLGDLEKISKPNDSYQRDIIPTHKKDIKDYLNKREFLFFPELILSYTLNADRDNVRLFANPDETITLSSKRGKMVSFSKSVTTYRGQLDSRNSDKIEIVTINIDDTLITTGEKIFHRIDGNHRLSASAEITDATTQRMPTPFCLILLRDDIADEKFESVVFYNINSKSEHLTSEENLKAILNEEYFSDDELKTTFSWAYVKARQLVKKIDFSYLDSIQNSFTNPLNSAILHTRTVAVRALEFLKEHKLISKGVSIKTLLEQLNVINSFYRQEPLLKASNDEGLLIAFLYYAFKESGGTTHLEAFKNWVIANKIYKIKINNPESVIEIYDKILEKEIKIFMAMPYYTDEDVDEYNIILERVITKIKATNNHLNLSMYPIMRERGASMDIVHNLLNNIRNCEIFIVDISENNPNVLFEYGYGISLDKKIILIRKASDKTPVPLDITHNLRVKYKDQKELESLLETRIRQTIIQLGYILND